ncbi:hypothetical protein BJX99DRAFT_254057 [Aspergillus californicus]
MASLLDAKIQAFWNAPDELQKLIREVVDIKNGYNRDWQICQLFFRSIHFPDTFGFYKRASREVLRMWKERSEIRDECHYNDKSDDLLAERCHTLKCALVPGILLAAMKPERRCIADDMLANILTPETGLCASDEVSKFPPCCRLQNDVFLAALVMCVDVGNASLASRILEKDFICTEIEAVISYAFRMEKPNFVALFIKDLIREKSTERELLSKSLELEKDDLDITDAINETCAKILKDLITSGRVHIAALAMEAYLDIICTFSGRAYEDGLDALREIPEEAYMSIPRERCEDYLFLGALPDVVRANLESQFPQPRNEADRRLALRQC